MSCYDPLHFHSFTQSCKNILIKIFVKHLSFRISKKALYYLAAMEKNNLPSFTLSIPEPVAKQIPKSIEMHGDVRQDPYYWLNERENPEVRAYLQAENDYLETALSPLKELREMLYQEMLSRIKQDDNTVPYPYKNYEYYIRHEHGKEYPIYCRKKRHQTDSGEQIILDVNVLATGQKFCHVTPPRVSPDEKKIVYGLDLTGRNLHRALIVDLESGQIIDQGSPVIGGGFAWAPDSTALFYETKDEETLRSDKVWLHILQTPFSADKLIYHETDETSYAHVAPSKDGQYLFIHSGYTENVECHFLPMAKYDGELYLFKKRSPGFYYSVEHFQGYFYILTNSDASNFKIARTPDHSWSSEHWADFIPHDEEVLLQEFDVFQNYLVLHERRNGLNQLRIFPWEDPGSSHSIQFNDPSYDCWLGANFELATDLLRVIYTSLTTPVSTYDYNMKTRNLELRKESPVLGDFRKENYQAEYFMAPARDGAQIPISLVYRKGFRKDGNAPLLLNAYGSYGISYDPAFSSTALSLLDRGFVVAIAHIRGGKEKGWAWYEKGKMMNKLNTFNDYIDCAQFLISEKYCSNERLFGRGGSAGGLLIGAVYNMEPGLFRGLLAHVPFVDVLTTMSDPNIPLTTGEYTEWGNPHILEQYFYMKKYSPIDNVSHQKYTHLLVTTGFSDSQVQYWEPAKWVAKLRHYGAGKNHALLFYTNLDAGHGGASGRFERLKDIALEYTFMMALLPEKFRHKQVE